MLYIIYVCVCVCIVIIVLHFIIFRIDLAAATTSGGGPRDLCSIRYDVVDRDTAALLYALCGSLQVPGKVRWMSARMCALEARVRSVCVCVQCRWS